MSQNKSVIDQLGQKLGVDKRVVLKATELNELLETRAGSSLSALRLAGSSREVVCLDLAAKTFGSTLSRADVIRLSSMNKKAYNDARKIIASMLGVEERLSLRELTIQFGCTGAASLATDILHRYISHQCGDTDFQSPLFLCASIIVACWKLKLKVPASKLREQCGAKKVVLDRLIAQMKKYAQPESDTQQKSVSRKRSLMEAVEEQIQEDEKRTKKHRLLDEQTGHENESKTSFADYEEWKRNILAKALRTP